MPGIYEYSFPVPEEAIDENNHVNNVVYVQWMQDAAVRHSDARGMTRDAYHQLQATWVAKTHHITYRIPAVAGDTIKVKTWNPSFTRTRGMRKYRFFREADGALLAEAETEWVFIDTGTGRPRAIPEEVSSAFEVMENADPGP